MTNFQTTYKTFSEVKLLSPTGKKHIVLLAGGMSAEREVSLSSAIGVAAALIKNGYKVTEIDMGADLASVLQNVNPDIVFNCLHGTYGEDGCVPGLLNILRIPYTHSGVLASALAFDKRKSREIFVSNNIKCAPAIIVKKEQNLKSDPMPRPYVIKPLCQGSSVGVQLIFPEDDFNFADYKFEYGNEILVEKYIKGRELQVAVLNGKALGVLEIELLIKRFYDYESKYSEGYTRHILPAQINESIYQKALTLSEKAFEVLGCRSVGRVEFIYSEEEEELYILEINTHPGFTPLSIVPEIASYSGVSFDDLIEELLSTAKYDN